MTTELGERRSRPGRDQIVALAARYAIPAMYWERDRDRILARATAAISSTAIVGAVISRPGAPPRSIESGATAAEKMIGAKSLDKAIEGAELICKGGLRRRGQALHWSVTLCRDARRERYWTAPEVPT